MKFHVRVALLMLLVAGLALVGCGSVADQEKPKTEAEKAKEVASAETKHEGWWCDEHGIPEEECSMCSPKVEKECKGKGDWCKKHKRAMSQCFYCNPDRRAFYAAKHVARIGKEPPPIPEFDEKKGGKKE